MKPVIQIAAVLVTTFVTVSAQSTPQAAADELLAADRAFAASGAKTDVVTALSAMFAPDVVLTHSGGIAYGLPKSVDALKANPINAGRIQWTPVRVSVSGDGRHGFTAGVMTLHRPDGATTPMKYLAYWGKQNDGWRVLAYKRGVSKMPAPATQVSFVLPKQLTTGATDAATIERYRESLAEAERSFSRDAQTMGIGPAFKHYGHPDAINLGGPDVPLFVLRNDQIAGAVGGNAPPNTSPVNWGSEKAIVAASGDFGVNIGYIVQNKPGADGKIPPGQPFFTIWKRDNPNDRWLYIAE
jgi:ketosteroid isomerase-like protein